MPRPTPRVSCARLQRGHLTAQWHTTPRARHARACRSARDPRAHSHHRYALARHWRRGLAASTLCWHRGLTLPGGTGASRSVLMLLLPRRRCGVCIAARRVHLLVPVGVLVIVACGRAQARWGRAARAGRPDGAHIAFAGESAANRWDIEAMGVGHRQSGLGIGIAPEYSWRARPCVAGERRLPAMFPIQVSGEDRQPQRWGRALKRRSTNSARV